MLSISYFAITVEVGKLSPEARLNRIVWGIVVGLAALACTFAFFALPLFALTDQTLLAVENLGHLRTLSRLPILDFAAQCLHCILMSSCVDFRMPSDGLWTM